MNPFHRGCLAICGLTMISVAPVVADELGTAPLEPTVLAWLNRLGYGPGPGALARISALGIARYVEQQLHPESLPEPADLKRRLAALETLQAGPVELFLEYGPPSRPRANNPTAVRDARQRANIIVDQAREARVRRALESPRQLQELLVDFWYNHFNVFAGKGLDHLWVADYETRAIRPHVFGRFRDLLGATARHPAMLFYLDNWQNTAPDARGSRGPFRGLNENYARELLELHTLGVDGGYTQADVGALARILTGWGIQRQGRHADTSRDGFYFDADRHDYGDKILLGHTIKGRGAAEVEAALDLIAAHPSTAQHICYQLAQFFVADAPPPTLVARLAARYRETQGELRSILILLFASPEFRASLNGPGKFKTPLQYVISSVRAAGLSVENTLPLIRVMQRLGEPLYGCLTPDGYKFTESAWLSPDAMLGRLNFATALGAGRLPLGEPANAQFPLDAHALRAELNAILRANTRTVVATAPPALQAGLILGSPELMYR